MHRHRGSKRASPTGKGGRTSIPPKPRGDGKSGGQLAPLLSPREVAATLKAEKTVAAHQKAGSENQVAAHPKAESEDKMADGATASMAAARQNADVEEKMAAASHNAENEIAGNADDSEYSDVDVVSDGESMSVVEKALAHLRSKAAKMSSLR